MRNGRYLNMEMVKNGLRLTLTNEGKEELEGLSADKLHDYRIFFDLFEDFLGNGWTALAAEDIGALTSCEIIITEDAIYSDRCNGELEDVGEVYWHERYAVESVGEKLLSGGLFLLRG